VDQWMDAPPELLTHLIGVAQKIAKGIDAVWTPAKVALMIAGLEVRHLHIHLTPIWDLHDFDRQDESADPNALDAHAEQLRDALRTLGYDGVAEH
jgi:diadenosine tetraphosphate (Ap4A) HIT family hydrolase